MTLIAAENARDAIHITKRETTFLRCLYRAIEGTVHSMTMKNGRDGCLECVEAPSLPTVELLTNS